MSYDIVVYDPNDDNPGGGELSAALAEIGMTVRWLLPRGASKADLYAPGVAPRQWLAGPRPWTIRRVLQRFLGPLALAWPLVRGKPVIAVWVHDAWDGLVIACLAAVSRNRLYFIHNNPRAVRPRRGMAARWEDFIVRHCDVIVHSEWLRQRTTPERPRAVHVIAHPNYSLTSASAPTRSPVEGRIGYVGVLRDDKGAGVLVDTLLAAGSGFELRTIGRGLLGADDVERLGEFGITYIGTDRIDQSGFLRELSRVHVVVAPYLQPTESGSVLLCMAMGVPVLALESPPMRRILNDQSTFTTTAELGAALGRFLRSPWPTYRLTSAEQRELCRRDLTAVFGALVKSHHTNRSG